MELPEFLAKLKQIGVVIDDLAHNWQVNSTGADRTKRAREGQALLNELIAVLTPPALPEAPETPSGNQQSDQALQLAPEIAEGAGQGSLAANEIAPESQPVSAQNHDAARQQSTSASSSDAPGREAGTLAPAPEIDPE